MAIKVQRPDSIKKVCLNLYCLKTVVRLAEKLQNSVTASKNDYAALLGEWEQSTYKEPVYKKEPAYSRRYANLAQARITDVPVLAVYDCAK